MSNSIAPSATQLTVSNTEWDNTAYSLAVTRSAERRAKGVTRQADLLNRAKLISMVCADYRNHFAAIYGKTERLPAAIFAEVEKAVDSFITSRLAEVNNANVITYRRAFAHKANDMEITERVTLVAENKLTLKEQHLGVNLFIGQCEKRLTMLQAKKTPDYDREKAVKQQIMKLQLTRSFVEAEQSNQAKVTT